MFSRLVSLQLKGGALRNDRGATAVEYGLMVAVSLLGSNLSSLFNDVAVKV
jgi:Flp pilus assembly pilin Flp